MIAGRPMPGQLELDDQHEGADEEQQPAHVRVGEDRHERIDPAWAVDPDRTAAQAVKALELIVVANDLAQTQRRRRRRP